MRGHRDRPEFVREVIKPIPPPADNATKPVHRPESPLVSGRWLAFRLRSALRYKKTPAGAVSFWRWFSRHRSVGLLHLTRGKGRRKEKAHSAPCLEDLGLGKSVRRDQERGSSLGFEQLGFCDASMRAGNDRCSDFDQRAGSAHTVADVP